MINQVMEDRKVLYLLGFSPIELDQEPVQRLAIENSLELLQAEGIQCWLRQLDASIFEGPDADTNLQDINWLTPRVLMHEAAVSTISEMLPFYPARFGTLFSSPEALLSKVKAWQPSLIEFFQLVRGNREWGIKVWIDRKQLEQHILSGHREPKNTELSGSEYLRLRKIQKELAEICYQFINRLLDEIEYAAKELQLPCMHRTASSLHAAVGDMELIGNLATLATSDKQDELCKRAESIIDQNGAAQFAKLERSGPWSAYSFSPNLE